MPWIVGFLAFTVYPFFASLYFSFTNFNIINFSPRWMGLDNYVELFSAGGNPMLLRVQLESGMKLMLEALREQVREITETSEIERLALSFSETVALETLAASATSCKVTFFPGFPGESDLTHHTIHKT